MLNGTQAEGEEQFHMVTDFRKLNVLTVPDSYPLSFIEEVLNKVECAIKYQYSIFSRIITQPGSLGTPRSWHLLSGLYSGIIFLQSFSVWSKEFFRHPSAYNKSRYCGI